MPNFQKKSLTETAAGALTVVPINLVFALYFAFTKPFNMNGPKHES